MRIFLCTLALASSLVACGECSRTAHAEMLLLELAWKQPNPVTLPVRHGFAIQKSSPSISPKGAWVEIVNQWPHQSWADEATVRALNLPLVTSRQEIEPNAPFIYVTTDDASGHQTVERAHLGSTTCWFPRLVEHRAEPNFSERVLGTACGR